MSFLLCFVCDMVEGWLGILPMHGPQDQQRCALSTIGSRVTVWPKTVNSSTCTGNPQPGVASPLFEGCGGGHSSGVAFLLVPTCCQLGLYCNTQRFASNQLGLQCWSITSLCSRLRSMPSGAAKLQQPLLAGWSDPAAWASTTADEEVAFAEGLAICLGEGSWPAGLV